LTTDYSGVSVSVIGLGVSNRPLIDWLLERGATVTARDKKSRKELGELADSLEARGVKLVCGEGYLDGITDKVIFRSPGIRFDKPQLAEAVARGAELISEMELFFELCPCPIIGITGSDGKTTTTTIIYKLLKLQFGSGRVFVGGNIGAPLLPRLDKITPDSYCVVELSSFQLQTMRRSPDVAVVTNITPNHLDYHLDMAEYIDAKRNIFRHQKPGSRLVLGAPCEVTRAMAAEAAPGVSVTLFGTDKTAGEVPEGFEVIDLAPCKMMVFQGPPFSDENFEEAITDIWEVMKTYDPKLYGFEWADNDAPRFQLSPEGYRGYIEARPVRKLS